MRDGAIAACADIVRAHGWVGRSRRAKGCARRAAGRQLGAGLRRLGVNVRRAGVVHGENEPHGVAPAFCTERINNTETRVALLVTDEAGIFATAEECHTPSL